jgi:hypothetical protein
MFFSRLVSHRGLRASTTWLLHCGDNHIRSPHEHPNESHFYAAQSAKTLLACHTYRVTAAFTSFSKHHPITNFSPRRTPTMPHNNHFCLLHVFSNITRVSPASSESYPRPSLRRSTTRSASKFHQYEQTHTRGCSGRGSDLQIA